MANKPGLMATLRAAARGQKARSEEDNQDDEIDEMEEDEETSPESEGDDTTPADEEDSDTVAEEDSGDETDENFEDDDDNEGDDTGPAATATRRERARCIAIFTHPNADAHPNLAMKLLNDGTSKASAISLLNSVSGGGSKASLAERVTASQGKSKPGQDGGSGGSKTKTAEARLVTVASKTLGRRKAAANSNG